MEIELPVEAIAPAIAAADVLTTGKNIRSSVFKCVLLDGSDGNQLFVRASSSTRSVEIVVPVKPTKPGKILVLADRLRQALTANKGAAVKFSETPNGCKVSFGSNKSFKFNTETPDDFPDLTFFSAKYASIKVNVDHLLDMCKRAVPLVHKEMSKMLLNGLCFHLVEEQLRVVGTNGTALCVTAIDYADGQDGEKLTQAVVYPDVIEMLPFVASRGTEIELQITDRCLCVRGDRGQGFSLRLAGNYPPYERALPKKKGTDIAIERTYLASILAQLDVLSYVGSPTVQLVLDNNKASWTADGADGRFHQEDDIVFTADKTVMYYNPTMLSAALKARKAENMTFEVTESLAPTVIREVNLPFESLCIFAPLRPGNV